MCLAVTAFWLGVVLTVAGVVWIAVDMVRRWVQRTAPALAPPAGGVSDALFAHVTSEVTRLRDYEWNMTVWAVTLLAAVVAAARISPAPVAQLLPFIQVGIGLIVILFVVHIFYAHIRLTLERAVYRALVERLGYTLQPHRATGRLTDGMGHILSWLGLILLIAGGAFYAVITWKTN